MQYPQAVPGLHSLGLADGDIRKIFRDMIGEVFAGYTSRKGKVRWIDKTPNYSRILPFVDELFEQRANYIILVRHPLDNVLSLQEFFREASVLHEDPDIGQVIRQYGNRLYGWAKHWRDINEQLHLFWKTAATRCHLVKYEDLAHSPEKELGKILDFLAVARTRGDAQKMCANAFRVCHDSGYEDTKIRSTTRVHEKSIYKWADWPPEERQACWTIVGRVAEEFGYRLL
jgi:Sulfotransferase family